LWGTVLHRKPAGMDPVGVQVQVLGSRSPASLPYFLSPETNMLHRLPQGFQGSRDQTQKDLRDQGGNPESHNDRGHLFQPSVQTQEADREQIRIGAGERDAWLSSLCSLLG
jgi:hypothetical protein